MSEGLSSTLWAMHPAFLDAILKRAALDAMVPDALRRSLSSFGGSIHATPAQPSRADKALIVPVTGILAPRGMFSGGTAYETIADRVREGAADGRIGTIILAIQSPGGTVWGCSEAADAIYAAQINKPVIAVASCYSFSAAHWLATQASRFYVTPSGDVGSVGVRSGHTDVSGLERKVGIKTTLIASSPDKIAGHPHAPLDDGARADLQAGVDEANRHFVAAIARGRRMKPSEVGAVHGTGRTLSAQRALNRGAVDGIASLRDVVSRYSSQEPQTALMRRRAAVAALAAAI